MEFKCKRCGECCRRYNPFTEHHINKCPHLSFDENGLATCDIYGDDRPDICKEWDCGGKSCFIKK